MRRAFSFQSALTTLLSRIVLLTLLLATLAGLVLPTLLLATLAGLVLATLLTTLVLLAALLVILVWITHRVFLGCGLVVQNQPQQRNFVPCVI